MKLCAHCGLFKEFFEFHKDKSNIDGLNGFCKVCRSEIHKKYLQTKNGKEKNYKAVMKYEGTTRGRAKRKVWDRKKYLKKKGEVSDK